MTGARQVRTIRRPAPRWLARAYAGFASLVLVGGVVAGVMLITSGWHTRAQERPVAGWVTTTGIVVDVHKVDTKSGYVYGPVVAFTDESGGHHQFTAPTSTDEPSFGSAAKVSYDPRDPGNAHDLSDGATSWAAPFVTGILITSFAGLMVVLVTSIGVHQYRRRHSDKSAT